MVENYVRPSHGAVVENYVRPSHGAVGENYDRRGLLSQKIFSLREAAAARGFRSAALPPQPFLQLYAPVLRNRFYEIERFDWLRL